MITLFLPWLFPLTVLLLAKRTIPSHMGLATGIAFGLVGDSILTTLVAISLGVAVLVPVVGIIPYALIGTWYQIHQAPGWYLIDSLGWALPIQSRRSALVLWTTNSLIWIAFYGIIGQLYDARQKKRQTIRAEGNT